LPACTAATYLPRQNWNACSKVRISADFAWHVRITYLSLQGRIVMACNVRRWRL